MTTSGSPGPDHLPFDELHEELADHPEGREALARLREAVTSEATARAPVEADVGVLHEIPVVRARIANWIASPTVQLWLDGLSEIGL